MLSKIGLVLLMLAFISSPAFAIVIDDFETGNLSNWTTRCGTWSIVSPGNGSTFAVRADGSENRLEHNPFAGSYGRYSYDVFFPSGAFIQDGDVLLQIKGGCNYLWFGFGPLGGDNSDDRVYLVSNNIYTILNCTPVHLTTGVWHTVVMERYPNGVIRVYTDGNLKIEAYDTTLTQPGTVALRAHSSGVLFDNVTFEPCLPPNPPIPTPSCAPITGNVPPCVTCDRCPPNGDINGDGSLSPADVVLMLNCTYLGAPGCTCTAP